MKVLTYGDIMDGGKSVFTSVAKLDGAKLILSFSGVIRVDNPYRHLENFVNELDEKLTKTPIFEIEIDFRELNFCNSNGFYVKHMNMQGNPPTPPTTTKRRAPGYPTTATPKI